MEVRILTRVRRIRQATRYDLRAEVGAVPCDAEGNPRIREFRVSLYRTVGGDVPEKYAATKIRYRRCLADKCTAWVDAGEVFEITVPTGMTTRDKYDTFSIEAYHGDKLLTSLTVLTVLDGRIGNKGAQCRSRVWNPNDSYMQGKDNEGWYDIALYRDNDGLPYERYLCLISHAPRRITPKEDVAQGLGFWASATELEFVATRLMLAERIRADQIDADGIRAKDVDIEGKITATSGAFNGEMKVGESFTIVGTDDYSQGIFYNYSNSSDARYGTFRFAPRTMSNVPRDSLLQENDATMNVLLYLERARNNRLDRVFYASGISEFNGRVAISSVNSKETTAKSYLPALFVEGGIGMTGGFHCEPVVLSGNSQLFPLKHLYLVDNDITIYVEQLVDDGCPLGAMAYFVLRNTRKVTFYSGLGNILYKPNPTIPGAGSKIVEFTDCPNGIIMLVKTDVRKFHVSLINY